MAAQAQAKAGQAEAKPKPAAKPPPLARPKAKPQPQPQAQPPPLPPSRPLAARKSAAAAAEDPEVQEMRGELKGLSASLAASKGAKAKLETKVSQWENKVAEVREIGDEERIRMAEDTFCKAKAKVVEKEKAIEALDYIVRRTELVLARAVDKVKEEEEDEAVEVDVEPQEMEEGMVKEEVEVKVVVETPAGGRGGEPWAQGDEGVQGWGGHPGAAMKPGSPGCPHPPNLDTPLLVASESPVWTLRFSLQRVPHRLGGGGVWVDEGGGGPLGQDPAPRGGQRVVGVAT